MFVNSKAQLKQVLADITCAPTCLDFKWDWEIKDAISEGGSDGWLVRTTFQRPDTFFGFISTGYGRWEYIERGTSESGVVKTAWLLRELILRHELMEAFLYKGIRIFNPHHTVEELSLPTLIEQAQHEALRKQ